MHPFWEKNTYSTQYYHIQNNTIERNTPLWNNHSYFGWRHVLSHQPIQSNTNKLDITIQQYAKQNSGIYFGIVTSSAKQGESCGLGGPSDIQRIAYVLLNSAKTGKLRVNGNSYLECDKDLFVPAGGKVSMRLQMKKKMVEFLNVSTNKSVEIYLPQQFLNQQLYAFVSLTHQGDRISLEQIQN